MDDGRTKWIDIDLPPVIEYRRSLLPESERERYLAADAFGREWLEKVRGKFPSAPLLVTASGLFYFFSSEKVYSLFKIFGEYGPIELVFDSVDSFGLKMIGHYMRQVGHGDVPVYFRVDRAAEVAGETGATLLAERPYYADICKKGMNFSTRATMFLSDLLMTVKMIHLRFGG